MLRSLRFTAAALVLAAAAGCQRGAYRPTAHFTPATSQPVGKTQAEDLAMVALIRPYHDKVTAEMRGVLGTAPLALAKKPGESPLTKREVVAFPRSRERGPIEACSTVKEIPAFR